MGPEVRAPDAASIKRWADKYESERVRKLLLVGGAAVLGTGLGWPVLFPVVRLAAKLAFGGTAGTISLLGGILQWRPLKRGAPAHGQLEKRRPRSIFELVSGGAGSASGAAASAAADAAGGFAAAWGGRGVSSSAAPRRQVY